MSDGDPPTGSPPGTGKYAFARELIWNRFDLPKLSRVAAIDHSEGILKARTDFEEPLSTAYKVIRGISTDDDCDIDERKAVRLISKNLYTTGRAALDDMKIDINTLVAGPQLPRDADFEALRDVCIALACDAHTNRYVAQISEVTLRHLANSAMDDGYDPTLDEYPDAMAAHDRISMLIGGIKWWNPKTVEERWAPALAKDEALFKSVDRLARSSILSAKGKPLVEVTYTVMESIYDLLCARGKRPKDKLLLNVFQKPTLANIVRPKIVLKNVSRDNLSTPAPSLAAATVADVEQCKKICNVHDVKFEAVDLLLNILLRWACGISIGLAGGEVRTAQTCDDLFQALEAMNDADLNDRASGLKHLLENNCEIRNIIRNFRHNVLAPREDYNRGPRDDRNYERNAGGLKTHHANHAGHDGGNQGGGTHAGPRRDGGNKRGYNGSDSAYAFNLGSRYNPTKRRHDGAGPSRSYH